MSIGATTYAFATVLASVLAGIALGAHLARLWADRVAAPRLLFGWAQLGVAAGGLLTLPLLGALVANDALSGWGDNWPALTALRFGVSLVVTLVPSTFMGMLYPLAGKLWTRDVGEAGQRLGALFAVNSAGNIAGAALTGFVLIPWLGLQRSVVALAMLCLLCAAWVFAGAEQGRRRVATRAALAVGCLVTATLLAFWQPAPFRAWDETSPDETVYYREGVSSTVKVVRDHENADSLWMAVDGIRIGQSLGGVDVKQQALAHFPFLLRPAGATQEVLTIGLGTGIIAGELLRHDEVRGLDCVEISGAVIEGASEFDEFADDALEDPRLRLIHDDGMNWLRRAGARYDAIVSDGKSRTTHATNAVFFSRDYYELCRERLAPGGLMIQWVPLNLPPRELRTILRTFVAVFPQVGVWVSPPHSAFIVGAEQQLVLDLPHIDAVLRAPATAHLQRYGVSSAASFVELLVAGDETLEDWLALDEPVLNTLDHPVLEFYSPGEHAVPPVERADDNLLGLLDGGEEPLQGVTLRGAGVALGRQRRAVALLGDAGDLAESPAAAASAEALRLIGEALALAPGHALVAEAAAASYRKLLEAHPRDVATRLALGQLLGSRGQQDAAIEQFRAVLAARPSDPRGLVGLAESLRLSGRLTAAGRHFERLVALAPNQPRLLEGLAYVLAASADPATRDPHRAVALARRANRLTGRRNPAVLDTLGIAYAASGQFEDAIAATRGALRLGPAPADAAGMRDRLALYRQGKPFTVGVR